MMKTQLVKLLAVLSEEKVSVVREMPYYKIDHGDIVFIDGYWCIWCGGWLERKCVHVRYQMYADQDYYSFHITKAHCHNFLVKVEECQQ